MKVMTIIGTRPEIIRLSLIMKSLDESAEKHVVVHTGQNAAKSLNAVFFEELKIREPDCRIHAKGRTIGEQLSVQFGEVERILLQEKPDKVLILGDTNSGLCSIIAERHGVPVYHMEAGNRCYDKKVPEEMNRRIIDTVSSFNLPYTQGSRQNLLREGIPSHRIIVTGNPIYEVMKHYEREIEQSQALETYQLVPGQYVLVTAHRSENVDDPGRLKEIMNGLHLVADKLGMTVMCSIHPRTRDKIERFGIKNRNEAVKWSEPFGFFDFVRLQQSAACIITDSGTVQEEGCLLRVPTVVIRDSTERPETVECGSSVLSGLHEERILECVKYMTGLQRDWAFPGGYADPDVSRKVTNLLLGGISYV